MSVQTAMAGLDSLVSKIDEIHAHLADEASEVSEQWETLGNMGAKREDHGAALLSRLRPHLQSLASFAGACQQQIDSLVADPFQD